MPKASKERKFRSSVVLHPAKPTEPSRSKVPVQVPAAAAHKPTKQQNESVSQKNAMVSGASKSDKQQQPERTVATAATTTKPKSQPASSSPEPQQATEKDANENNLLSRGQRKRQAKRDQYLRKEKMILSSLRVQHAVDQSKRIDGLDALKEALLATVGGVTPRPSSTSAAAPAAPAPASSSQPASTTLPPTKPKHTTSMLQSNRGRKRLLQKELTQMNLVWQHPAYQADPFATMREHLQNTLSKSNSQPPLQKSLENKKPKSESVHRKRKKTKVRVTRSKSR